MCKHVAATLYGVGARLDHEPEMLFTLRCVDPAEMVEAAMEQPVSMGEKRKGRVLQSEDLSSLFGVDIDVSSVVEHKSESKSKHGQAESKHAQKKPKSTTKKKTMTKPAARKGAAKKRSKKTAVRKMTNSRKNNAKKTATKKATKTNVKKKNGRY